MGNLTRRDFMHGATVFAAGAAVGIPASKIREHGPVDLRMYFFSSKLFVLKVGLHSDEAKDLFGIRVLPYDRSDKPGEVRLPLSKVREIVEFRAPAGPLKVECKNSDGEVEQRQMLLTVAHGDLIIRDGETPSAPFWLSLKDVRRVL